MVNTVKQKVYCQEKGVIRQEIVEVEEETMHPILQYRPDKVAQEETGQRLHKRFRRQDGQGRKGK